MRGVFLTLNLSMACLLVIGARGHLHAQQLPLIDGKRAVATVNGEPISLEELDRAIASSHAARSEKEKAGRIVYSGIINRLINIRLILLEARNMGLDELPEIKEMVDKYAERTLMELLLKGHVKDLKVDEDEVERLYREEVREWKLRSVTFEKAEDAEKMKEEIKAGKDFDEVLKQFLEKGTAKGGGEGEYLSKRDLKEPVVQILSEMEVGAVSPILSAGKNNFIIFKLEGVRLPEEEDKKAREWAKQEALNRKRRQAAEDYYSELKRRYVKISEDLFDALDYESKEARIEALLKDERVLVEIEGEKPITVGEFTGALQTEFYHGIDKAIESQSVNAKKEDVLEGILEKRLFRKEALRQGLTQTKAYKERITEYEASVVFGAFVNKVVAPEIRLAPEALEKYYRAHMENFTFPPMMRIKSLVFGERTEAVDALEKLRAGTDFSWLSATAGGQLPRDTQGLLNFDGRLLSLRTLSEDLQKTLSGANPGDFRLYVSPQKHFYVLYIYHVIQARPQPFEAVKEKIAEKIFEDKVKEAVELWANKLREYYPVEIFFRDMQK